MRKIKKDAEGAGKPIVLELRTKKPAVEDIRAAEVRRLVDIAKHDSSAWNRVVAVKKLDGNIVALTEIARDFGSLKYKDSKMVAIKQLSKYVKTIDNPLTLVCIACHSPYENSRKIALEKLGENQVALREVLKYSDYDDTLKGAIGILSAMVSKLKDPEALLFVAQFSTDEKSKEIAFKKLEGDADFLIEVAKHCGDGKRRQRALKKLENNPAALREIAKQGYYLDTSKEAIKKLLKLSKELSDSCILEGLPKLR